MREAEDKDTPSPGVVLLTPTDYHTLVEDDGKVALSTEGPVQNARPSIDVLFRSAAEAYRERCVGVVLTGTNEDGADGLPRIEELGGVAIVQEPSSAERSVMPAAALAATKDAVVLPLEEIGLYAARPGSEPAALASRGAGGGTRTHDLRITSALLCQLSYSGARRSVATLLQDFARLLVRQHLALDPLERVVDRLRVAPELGRHLLVARALEVEA